MTPPDLTSPLEAPRDPVEIRQDAAITIQQALEVAASQAFPIGKSTLQRWAHRWSELGTASPVKALIVSSREGSYYLLDREDLSSWIIEQQLNRRPRQTSGDLLRSHQTSRDLSGSRETLQDPWRSHEAPPATSSERTPPPDAGAAIEKLRDENRSLKIDVAVRDQLLKKADEQIKWERQHSESLLREVGALALQVEQLKQLPPAPEARPAAEALRPIIDTEGEGRRDAFAGYDKADYPGDPQGASV